MINVALPKGRIANSVFEIFSKAFEKQFEFYDRKLILEIDNFRFLSVRHQDVPTYVLKGGADVGVAGFDVLEEQNLDVLKILNLNISKCKICVGVLKDYCIDYSLPEIKIATKMPNIARSYFAKKSISADIIKLYGSIELAPIINMADAIVDIVETGETLKQNGLKVSEVIMECCAHMIANKNSFITKRDEILNLCEKISEFIPKC